MDALDRTLGCSWMYCVALKEDRRERLKLSSDASKYQVGS